MTLKVEALHAWEESGHFDTSLLSSSPSRKSRSRALCRRIFFITSFAHCVHEAPISIYDREWFNTLWAQAKPSSERNIRAEVRYIASNYSMHSLHRNGQVHACRCRVRSVRHRGSSGRQRSTALPSEQRHKEASNWKHIPPKLPQQGSGK